MRLILRLALLLVLLLPAAPAFADWCPLGPDGGAILALAVDPRDSRVVYAGTELPGRLYKTVDGGETWRLTGQGLPVDGYMLALAVDPRRRATVWAATAQHGVYKSTDAGASWSPSLPRRTGFDGYTFDLAVDPRTPDTVYVATTAGIFKTLNGGVRWRLKSRGLPNENSSLGVVEVDPGRPSVVYAAGSFSGLYRTLNGGETWTPAGLELPEQEAVTSLAATSGAVYAGTSKGRLFKSTDRGATWFPASVGLPQKRPIVSIAIHPRTPRIVYAGLSNYFPGEEPAVYRSGNGGASWTPVVTGLTSPEIWKLAFGPPDSGLPGVPLYAATGRGTSPGGVFRSDDGRTWRYMVGGLSATWVRDVAAEPGDPGVLWSLLLTPGLFRSGDGGSSWTQLDLGEDVLVLELAADPRLPGTLYAMALVTPGPSPLTLFKTTDSGGSWARSDLPAGGNLKIDPRTGVLFLVGEGALYRSADGGVTWNRLVVGSVSDVAFPDSPSSVVFAAGAQQVFKSVDGGVTWTRGDAALEEVEQITRIVAVPGAPSTLVATDGTSMFRSTDASATWQKTFVPASEENVIESLLAAPDGTLYSYVFRQGLFVSHDGVTWTPFDPGLPPGGRINNLILDPDDPETLYAASTDSVQVFRPGVCSNDAF